MDTITPVRAVLDTNVVFEGLTNRGNTCGLIIDAWRADVFRACVSNALAYEYQDVLSRKLSDERWRELKLVLHNLLGKHTLFTQIYFSWRPASPDPGDDHVINCVMNANALLVTSNVRDFRQSMYTLGLQIMSPVAFVNHLTEWV